MGQMFAQETVFDICLRFKCRRPRHELRGYRNLCTPENTQQGKLVDHHHPIFPSLSLGRFWRSTGLRGAQWQVVPGWFGQLGNGLRTSKFLRSVHQDHSSAGLDEPNHGLRKVHLCPLPSDLRAQRHLFLTLLTCLAEKEFLCGMLSDPGCSSEQGKKNKKSYGGNCKGKQADPLPPSVLPEGTSQGGFGPSIQNS